MILGLSRDILVFDNDNQGLFGEMQVGQPKRQEQCT
jgi:hypothetical protein